MFDDFFVARKPLKRSPHTEAAYRRELATISAQLAADLGIDAGELRLEHSGGRRVSVSMAREFGELKLAGGEAVVLGDAPARAGRAD